MTRIDEILSIFGSKEPLIGAIQFTPWNVLLTISEEKFWEFMKLSDSFSPKMKFLEKRNEEYIDIHYLYEKFPKSPLDITFRLSSPSSEFLDSLREKYPFINIFLMEI